MGCFFACFGSSKDPKRLKNRRTDQRSSVQRNAIANSIQQSSSVHALLGNSNNKPLHSVLEAGNRNISTTEEVISVKSHEHVVLPQEDAVSVHEKKEDQKEEDLEKSSKPESSSEDFAVPFNPDFRSSHPPIYRYGNCKDSDDEDEVFSDHLASDDNDENKVSSVADSSMYDSGLNRNIVRHRNAYICPVLNPVENLSQWNAVKSKGALPSTPQKENLALEQASAYEDFPRSPMSSREVRVDASLSNWLASSEVTPVSKITTTMDLEATTTPVKSSTLQGLSSVRRSSHEVRVDASLSNSFVAETVDKYWRQGLSDKDRDSASSFKGIPNTTSKYREDKTVKWHSTPFETRLERALNSRGAAKA